MVTNDPSPAVAQGAAIPRDPRPGQRRASALRNAPATILPIACIVGGLLATAAWITFLGFELFRAIELLL
jgi:hypothetical protein